jgi:hypothetical protein
MNNIYSFDITRVNSNGDESLEYKVCPEWQASTFQYTLRIRRENWEDSYNDWMKNWGLLRASPDKPYHDNSKNDRKFEKTIGYSNNLRFVEMSEGATIDPIFVEL